jgi:hypothetical protein
VNPDDVIFVSRGCTIISPCCSEDGPITSKKPSRNSPPSCYKKLRNVIGMKEQPGSLRALKTTAPTTAEDWKLRNRSAKS